jgi:hypothetical protein
MLALLKNSPGGRPGKFSIIFIILWLAACLAEVPLAGAQEANQVKAAFLYNFAKFVEWPPGAFADGRDVITLCLFEHDPLASALAGLHGKLVQGRTLSVRKCRRVSELKGCQIFFASAADKSWLVQALAALRDLPVLTVSDSVADFVQLGGIINLIPYEDKIRFEISVDNARQAHLKISSQLLKLASPANH